MKLLILLALGVSCAVVQVSCNEVMLRYLLSSKTALVTQMEQQIGRTRSVMSSTTTGQLWKFIANIDEAHKFATYETESFAGHMEAWSEACLAGAPTTIQEILITSNGLLDQCIQSVLDQVMEIEQTYGNSLEDYRTAANDLNLIFARDYFKKPETVFTTELFMEAYQTIRTKAILWDNVDSIDLYSQNKVHVNKFTEVDSSLYGCVMAMKEFVGTEIGRLYLYSWNC